jgi:hypothetical protein
MLQMIATSGADVLVLHPLILLPHPRPRIKIMSTVPTSNGHPNPSPENDSSTQVKSSHDVGVERDRSLGSRAKVLADEYPNSAVQAVSRIEIDETFLPEKFQLPDDGYYGILWHAFHRPDDIRTEARITHPGFALFLAREHSPCYQDKATTLLGPHLQSWVELGALRRMLYLWISKPEVRKGDRTYEVVKKCEETTSLGRKLLQGYKSRMNKGKSGNEMELELLVDGRGMIDGSRRLVKSRLEWWN